MKSKKTKICLADLRAESESRDTLRDPILGIRDPGIEDSIAFGISGQMNPFWVNQRTKPYTIWAWWDGRYRMLDLDT